MPKSNKSKTQRKSVSLRKNIVKDFSVEEKETESYIAKDKKQIVFPTIILTVVVLLILFLTAKEKLLAKIGLITQGKIFAAVVNGKIITRAQLNDKMTTSYGKQTLENMIVENLINEEAAKKEIKISEKDIDNEIEKITKTLDPSVKLEDALKFQGLTLVDFRKQMKTRLMVNKILEKDITITEDEISKYLKDEGKFLTATGEAERKAQASEKLKEQKIGEKVQTWVNDLISKAKISRFIQ